MAIALTTYNSRYGSDGMAYVRADLQSDTLPVQMPAIGAEVDGLDDIAVIDVGSTMIVLDDCSRYIMGEDLEWHLWTEAGGGGGEEPEPEEEPVYPVGKWLPELDEIYESTRPNSWPEMPKMRKNEIYLLSKISNTASKKKFDVTITLDKSGEMYTAEFGNIEDGVFKEVVSVVRQSGTATGAGLSGSMFTAEYDDETKIAVTRITAETSDIVKLSTHGNSIQPIIEIYAYMDSLNIYNEVAEKSIEYITCFGEISANRFYGNAKLKSLRANYVSFYEQDALYGCETLQLAPALSLATLRYAFTGCKSLRRVTLSTEDVYTDAEYAFKDCESIEYIPYMDTSRITQMREMFKNCKKIVTIPELDTSNVTETRYMFAGCSSLIAIPKLDLSKVKNIRGMYENCSSLVLASISDDIKMTTNDAESLFFGCTGMVMCELDISNISGSPFNGDAYSLKYVDITGNYADEVNAMSLNLKNSSLDACAIRRLLHNIPQAPEPQFWLTNNIYLQGNPGAEEITSDDPAVVAATEKNWKVYL